jgi:hypothetical protein
MPTRVLARLGLIIALLLAPAAAMGWQDQEVATQDIVHLADGRVLEGKILSEKGGVIVFEYVHRRLGISTTLKLNSADVVKLERDVPIKEAPKEEKTSAASSSKSSDASDSKAGASDRRSHFGVGAVQNADSDATSFYMLPMKGQMGTDVNVEVYREMIDDIRANSPDYLIIEMECVDKEDRLYSRISQNDKGFDGSTYLDMYRELVNLFRDELRDIPQVLWVKDSEGISSIIALSWPNLYMTPDARLGGTAGARRNFAVQDAEVHAKFREAYMAWLKGFAENGQRSLELVDAMVIPDYMLSASWKGRDVNWNLNSAGHYLVDNDDETTAGFRARDAEDLLISRGTAADLDELVLLLGYREYRAIEGQGEKIFEKYRDDWRRVFDRCAEWLKDYEQYMGWASGEDELKYLGRAKSVIEKIIAAAQRYKAVEVRLLTDMNTRVFDLVTIVETIKERIRSIRQSGRGGANRGGGGGGRGTGGGIGGE